MQPHSLLPIFLLLLHSASPFLSHLPFFRPSKSPSSPSSGPSPLQSSYFSGNQNTPSASDMSVLDEMIDKLSKTSPYELPNAVSASLKVVGNPRFFVRIAERADMAETADEKALLSNLANNLATTLAAVVSTAEDKMDDRAEILTSILQSAAETDGEFLVPLSPQRLAAMRDAMEEVDSAMLDEAFLTTVDAWMNKSSKDGLDGMVAIFQKVLQLYASVALRRGREALCERVRKQVAGNQGEQSEENKVRGRSDERQERRDPFTCSFVHTCECACLWLSPRVWQIDSPAKVTLGRLLAADPDTAWDDMLREIREEVTPATLTSELQKVIEGVVLGLQNGSMMQRVQAEYCRELASRIQTPPPPTPASSTQLYARTPTSPSPRLPTSLHGKSPKPVSNSKKSVQVKLLDFVDGVGSKNDIVMVTPSYWSNFLMKKQLATVVSDAEVAKIRLGEKAARAELRADIERVQKLTNELSTCASASQLEPRSRSVCGLLYTHASLARAAPLFTSPQALSSFVHPCAWRSQVPFASRARLRRGTRGGSCSAR